jgi:SAM-dependent methyltransferase
LYNGRIRTGGFGNLSVKNQTVYCCESCGTGFLPDAGFDYEDSEYREAVDGAADLELFQGLHDSEQAERITVIGSESFRNSVIADIGCGGGSFLDFVSGVADKTIAVEPCSSFQKELARKHKVYSYVRDTLEHWAGKVDLVVSFAVMEHVDDPLFFLQEIRQLIKPGGKVLISTPNYDDWLLQFLPEIYGCFFYRKAHKYYFNGRSIKKLAGLAGFNSVELVYKNRFDLSNALHWLRDNKPTGIGKVEMFTELDCSYKSLLERSGKADFIYAWLTV